MALMFYLHRPLLNSLINNKDIAKEFKKIIKLEYKKINQAFITCCEKEVLGALRNYQGSYYMLPHTTNVKLFYMNTYQQFKPYFSDHQLDFKQFKKSSQVRKILHRYHQKLERAHEKKVLQSFAEALLQEMSDAQINTEKNRLNLNNHHDLLQNMTTLVQIMKGDLYPCIKTKKQRKAVINCFKQIHQISPTLSLTNTLRYSLIKMQPSHMTNTPLNAEQNHKNSSKEKSKSYSNKLFNPAKNAHSTDTKERAQMDPKKI